MMPTMTTRHRFVRLTVNGLTLLVSGLLANAEVAVPSLDDVLRQADVLVDGEITDVMSSRIDPWGDFVNWVWPGGGIACPPPDTHRYRATINIHASYPLLDAQTLTIEGRTTKHGIPPKSVRGVYALKLPKSPRADPAHYRPILFFKIDDSGDKITRILGVADDVSLELAWEFLRDCHDALHDAPTAATIEKWKGRLGAVNSEESRLATAYLRLCVPDAMPAELLVEWMAKLFTARHNTARQADNERFVLDNLPVLAANANSAIAERFLHLYAEDLERHDSFADGMRTHRNHLMENSVVELATRLAPASRAAWFEKLYLGEIRFPGRSWVRHYLKYPSGTLNVLASAEGRNNDVLLSAMLSDPGRYRLITAYDLGALWRAMAQRGHPEIRPVLEAEVRAHASFREPGSGSGERHERYWHAADAMRSLTGGPTEPIPSEVIGGSGE
jgi:hypothetical protein